MKGLIVVILFSLAFCLSAADGELDGLHFEDSYSFNWEMPGDGGEGGGKCLVRFTAEDIFDQVEIYPHKSALLNFFWSLGGLTKSRYAESARHTAKYSATNAIMLHDIYKYQTIDGEIYKSEDIFFYYIDKRAVADYQNGNRDKNPESLLPFSFVLDDLYAFEMPDGTIVNRSDIKVIYYKR